MSLIVLIVMVNVLVVSMLLRAVSKKIPLSFLVFLSVIISIYLATLDWVFRPFTLIYVTCIYLYYLFCRTD